jgi:uncharacterized protein
MSTSLSWSDKLVAVLRKTASADPAHDELHCHRVLANALRIAQTEGGDPDVLTAAAFLHDIANLPKTHPDSWTSSELSAKKAGEVLRGIEFPEAKIPAVLDAILCHSYSRGLEPRTHEGRVFQDADRLDAIGAVGIARTFTVGGACTRALYSAKDPFCHEGRAPNDKLLGLGQKMKTPTGQKMAEHRLERMRRFLDDLEAEITSGDRPDAPA